jgi:hypothetical protein
MSPFQILGKPVFTEHPVLLKARWPLQDFPHLTLLLTASQLPARLAFPWFSSMALWGVLHSFLKTDLWVPCI